MEWLIARNGGKPVSAAVLQIGLAYSINSSRAACRDVSSKLICPVFFVFVFCFLYPCFISFVSKTYGRYKAD
jgi:hypothetical protein